MRSCTNFLFKNLKVEYLKKKKKQDKKIKTTTNKKTKTNHHYDYRGLCKDCVRADLIIILILYFFKPLSFCDNDVL